MGRFLLDCCFLAAILVAVVVTPMLGDRPAELLLGTPAQPIPSVFEMVAQLVGVDHDAYSRAYAAELGTGTDPCSGLGCDEGRDAFQSAIDHAIKLDHVGYRPGDAKVAIFTADPGATVEVRTSSDTTVFTIPTDGGSISSQGFDDPSGDDVWWVDFSAFATPGTYRLHCPALGGDSYDFEIAADVYDRVGEAALQTFYLQRCNTPKLPQYAGDWADDVACHVGVGAPHDGDLEVGPAAGHADYGTLELTGGWHDAGDYNKYVWGAVASAIHKMLRSYEDNPGVFFDGQLDIPESTNGIPDILDEIKVELDWMLEMQLDADTNPSVPAEMDGAVLSQMHVVGYDADSPPSADTSQRFYHDPNPESGAVFAGVTAQAARLFAAAGMNTFAGTLEAASLDAWDWLEGQGSCTSTDYVCQIRVWAAAEIFRTDPTHEGARGFVDDFYADWANRCFDPARYDGFAAITYIQSAGATASVVSDMQAGIVNTLDWCVFPNEDLYRNGMPSWAYYWGSNAPRADHGLLLLAAANLGLTPAGMTADDLRDEAQDFLHFFLGQNPLNMVYLTNMIGLGGEHSSWQLYHAWFGSTWEDPYSLERFVGKPPEVAEPDYPYYEATDNFGVSDDKISTYGPPPGFVPGGPNKSYSGASVPPAGAAYENRAYRDWCDQRDLTGGSPVWADSRTWEITESSIGYQGPFVALAGYFMSATPECTVGPGCEVFSDGFESGDTSRWSFSTP